MANILNLRTVGDNTILVVDADPSSGGGTEANTSSIAMLDSSGIGHFYLKVGPTDPEWIEIASNGTNINTGAAGRLSVYAASGNALSDNYVQNGQAMDVAYALQPTRSAPIEYTIPNPGDAVTAANFILSEGPQTLNGMVTLNNDMLINGNLTVEGTMTTIDSSTLVVADKLFTVNVNGLANSGDGSGFQIEENGLITGYMKTDSARTGWLMKAPGSAGALDMSTASLTGDQTVTAQDLSGYMALQSAPGVVSQVPFFNSSLQLTNESGTGSSSLSWDTTNKRLGIGTSAPARTLDVAGSSILRGDVRIQDNNGVNFEIMTSSTNTTDATLTTCESIATSADQTLLIEVRVVARLTGGTAGSPDDSAGYIRTFLAKNVAGVVSLQKYDSIYTAEDQTPWDVQASVSGVNILVKVKGAANNNIQWNSVTFVQTV